MAPVTSCRKWKLLKRKNKQRSKLYKALYSIICLTEMKMLASTIQGSKEAKGKAKKNKRSITHKIIQGLVVFSALPYARI